VFKELPAHKENKELPASRESPDLKAPMVTKAQQEVLDQPEQPDLKERRV
jgi:hypothetical protein